MEMPSANTAANVKIKGVLLRKGWKIRGRHPVRVNKKTSQARDEEVSVKRSSTSSLKED